MRITVDMENRPLERDAHVWRELTGIKGYMLVLWDDTSPSYEPLFVPVKHARDAAPFRDSNRPKAWRDKERLLGYPEWCGRGGADRRTVMLNARVQRGLTACGPAVSIAEVKCNEANMKKMGDLLHSWADKGNKAMSGNICGLGIRVHFFATIRKHIFRGGSCSSSASQARPVPPTRLLEYGCARREHGRVMLASLAKERSRLSCEALF